MKRLLQRAVWWLFEDVITEIIDNRVQVRFTNTPIARPTSSPGLLNPPGPTGRLDISRKLTAADIHINNRDAIFAQEQLNNAVQNPNDVG